MCFLCFQKFGSPSSSYHMTCPFCFQTYTTKPNYKFHLRAVHGVGETVECKRCGRTDFNSRYAYFAHKKKKNCAPKGSEVIEKEVNEDVKHEGQLPLEEEKLDMDEQSS